MPPGVAHTIVRPGFFADAYLVTIGLSAHLGIFPWIFGDSRNAPPSNEDIARVAAATLMEPARHAGKSYRPTGPELLGSGDMAKAIGRAVGRSVKVVPIPTWLREFAQFMIAPLSPGFNLDRYDRELRRPFPSEPQFASESKVWLREHAFAHAERGAVIAKVRTERA